MVFLKTLFSVAEQQKHLLHVSEAYFVLSESVGTLPGNGLDKTFVTNTLSVCQSLPISVLHLHFT